MIPTPRSLRRGARALLSAPLLALPLGASGACSRPITVPVAPTGHSVIVAGDTVSGAFPDMLRELGDKMGCKFVFPVVPRARLAAMFLQTGEADLMLPASRSTERDRLASFVPMMTLKMALISVKQRQVRSDSIAHLLASPQWNGITVRSYVFGDEYNALVRGLEAQKRMFYVNSLEAVARMLQVGRADFTVMAPSMFLSSLGENPVLADLRDKLEYTALEGLPPSESGVYVSRRSLSGADQAELLALLERARKGVLWKWFQKYYPAEMLQYVVLQH